MNFSTKIQYECRQHLSSSLRFQKRPHKCIYVCVKMCHLNIVVTFIFLNVYSSSIWLIQFVCFSVEHQFCRSDKFTGVPSINDFNMTYFFCGKMHKNMNIDVFFSLNMCILCLPHVFQIERGEINNEHWYTVCKITLSHGNDFKCVHVEECSTIQIVFRRISMKSDCVRKVVLSTFSIIKNCHIFFFGCRLRKWHRNRQIFKYEKENLLRFHCVIFEYFLLSH